VLCDLWSRRRRSSPSGSEGDISDLSDLTCDITQAATFEIAGDMTQRYLSAAAEHLLKGIEVADSVMDKLWDQGFFC
jgi:hypothetical protein